MPRTTEIQHFGHTTATKRNATWRALQRVQPVTTGAGLRVVVFALRAIVLQGEQLAIEKRFALNLALSRLLCFDLIKNV